MSGRSPWDLEEMQSSEAAHWFHRNSYSENDDFFTYEIGLHEVDETEEGEDHYTQESPVRKPNIIGKN